MNIVFAGTPSFALPCLDALKNSRHELKAIYTQPDRPAGRGRKLQASAVKEWALSHQLPVFQPVNFKEPEPIQELSLLEPDVLIVIAYGLLLPKAVLDLPRYGCINVHASLLPRWRGASPIQHALLKGDDETGVTIMQMDSGMDTGPMLATVSCPIYSHDTAGLLHDRLAQLAPAPLLETLEALPTNSIQAICQETNLATYAPKIKKEDAAIEWHKPASVVDCQIRAYNPWPIAYTHTPSGPLRIHQAEPFPYSHQATPGSILSLDKRGMLVATGEGALLVKQIQFPGGKIIPVADWLHSSRDQLSVGMVLQ